METEEQLVQRLNDAKQQVEPSTRYQHYKGNTYKVIDVALTEGDALPAVIYQAEYGSNLTFIRALDSWLEEVEWEGETVKRFTKI